MRIDISLQNISNGDMENWVDRVERFVESHRDCKYNIRYGDDWEDKR